MREWNRKNPDKVAASNRKRAVYLKQWREENRERQTGNVRRWREANRERFNASSRAWKVRNKERVNQRKRELAAKQEPGARRNHMLRFRYGITSKQFDEMAESQKFACAICRQKRRLVVDHDHATGVVRGLLCSQCNHVLGHAYDDAEVLSRAIEYLGAGRSDLRAIKT